MRQLNWRLDAACIFGDQNFRGYNIQINNQQIRENLIVFIKTPLPITAYQINDFQLQILDEVLHTPGIYPCRIEKLKVILYVKIYKCNAGIRSFGILSNGDITGCTSIRGVEFVEGNIRQRSLRDIWEDPSSFSWRRRMGVEQLGENCSKCMYGKSCLGGCPNTRHTVNGSIYSDNPYCAYADFKFFKKRSPKT